MLLNRLQICLLITIPCIAGCGGDAGSYRPLTETSATTTSATTETAASQTPSAAAPEALSVGRTETAASSGVSPASAAGENMAKPVAAAPGTPASLPPPQQTSVPEEKGNLKDEPTASPASSTLKLSATETNMIPGGNRGLLNKSEKGPATKPLQIKLLVPDKDFVREGKSQSLRVTFDDLDLLKVCNMEPVPPDVMDHLPDWMKNLNGQKIILRGWMFPSGRQEGISSFMFVRDNGICCFGRDPKVYDKLAVTMQPGKTTTYIAGRPFDVEATLLIEPDIEGSEEGLWWLYRLENARVIDQ